MEQYIKHQDFYFKKNSVTSDPAKYKHKLLFQNSAYM